MEWVIVGGALLLLVVLANSSSAMTPVQQPAPQITTTTYYFDNSPDDSNTLPIQSTTFGIDVVAQAIATAEGYFVANSIPWRANNPGDLVIPGWTGPTLGLQNISVFTTQDEGWRRLFHQLDLIRTGQSRVYTPGMSIAQVAALWTSTDQNNWATNVCRYLNNLGANTTPDSVIGDLLSADGQSTVD